MREWPRRPAGSSRRLAEILVTAVAALLVAGVLIGTNIGRDRATLSDGLTWLGDGTSGEVLQINAATGRTENRLAVALPGDGLSLSQTETLLVVTNTSTGAVSVIDIATLTTGGQFQATPGGTRVLLADQELYVVDRPSGTITRLHPVTAAPVGAVWRAGHPLADAAVDDTPMIWTLDVTGVLHQLTWSAPAQGLVDAVPAREVAGTGGATVLVPHPQGVTLAAPDSGRFIQVGTNPEVTVAAPLVGTLAPAGHSPADLVPVASPEAGQVTILSDRATAHTVDTRALGCAHPGPPAVHGGAVYVPCDTGRVLVLGRDGGHQRDIAAAFGATPHLIPDDGLLYIYTPGKTGGRYVAADGAVHEISTDRPTGPDGAPSSPRPRSTPRPSASVPVGTPTPTPTPTPQAGPANGDLVVDRITGTLYIEAGIRYREYSIYFTSAWHSFAGTCTLQIQGSGPLAENRSMPCTTPSTYLGTGDGTAYTVSVRFCGAQGCVTSNSKAVTTVAPIDVGGDCGQVRCIRLDP